jgi:hypothetical protein
MQLFRSREQSRQDLRVLLELFVGPLGERLRWSARLQYFLNGCFAIVGGLVVGGWLSALWSAQASGADAVPGIVDSLSTAQGPVGTIATFVFGFFFGLLKIGLSIGLLFGVPFVVIYSVLGALPNFRSRLPGYAGVVALLLIDHLRLGADRPTTEVPQPSAASTEAPAAQATQADATRIVESESRDEEARPARQALVAEVEALTVSARTKWRADVEAAQAFGNDGQVPPMLRVQEQDGDAAITNSGARPVCVAVARVERDAGGAVVSRCRLGLSDCQQISAGGSRRFPLYRGSAPTCERLPLEFRVGSVTNPEPSWWSRSALDSFDPTNDGHDHTRLPTPMLAAEKAALLPLLEEDARARRWQLELQSGQ